MARTTMEAAQEAREWDLMELAIQRLVKWNASQPDLSNTMNTRALALALVPTCSCSSISLQSVSAALKYFTSPEEWPHQSHS